MNQRLVWNFEFTSTKKMDFAKFIDKNKEEFKWEQRFFWSDDQIIGLCNIDNALLDLTLYQQKHKEDYYYVIPGANYNIKRRDLDLQYKPLLNNTQSAFGYGAKIHFDKELDEFLIQDPSTHQLININSLIKEKGIPVLVKKEALIYKFPTSPHIKLELARLEVNNALYFSACIEGKSLELVEKLSQLLLGNQVSCEYVSFLKNILKI